MVFCWEFPHFIGTIEGGCFIWTGGWDDFLGWGSGADESLFFAQSMIVTPTRSPSRSKTFAGGTSVVSSRGRVHWETRGRDVDGGGCFEEAAAWRSFSSSLSLSLSLYNIYIYTKLLTYVSVYVYVFVYAMYMYMYTYMYMYRYVYIICRYAYVYEYYGWCNFDYEYASHVSLYLCV